eukprot:TRINITY_DN4306_c0_g1_i1.p1 TRINITY_DN4306_c0_g1~~TRINITY_DN4306_c0_g1_i1.p1  ORF type:complete len:454 (-),score=152.03 TRINITY_DN4306_c0_g1_i1:37-1374(-)
MASNTVNTKESSSTNAPNPDGIYESQEKLKEIYPNLFRKDQDVQFLEVDEFGNSGDSELVFVGTGTSSGMPRLRCLLHQRPVQCETCLDALIPGSKNKRKNPSLLIRYKKKFNILIDCGKSFRESMVNIVASLGITRIDAVIITHEHADAILGLDDLREFTEDFNVPVYTTEKLLVSLGRVFPYLVNTNKATGSGYVAKIQWNTFNYDEPFDVCGLKVTAVEVDHGPNNFCSAFVFGRIAYVSDVKSISAEAEEKICNVVGYAELKGEDGKVFKKPNIDVLIVDSLLLNVTNGSHWCLIEALKVIQKWVPKKTILVGMSHLFDYRWTNAALQRLKEPFDEGRELKEKEERKERREKRIKEEEAKMTSDEVLEERRQREQKKAWRKEERERLLKEFGDYKNFPVVDDKDKPRMVSIYSIIRKYVDRSKLVDIGMGYDGLRMNINLQ